MSGHLLRITISKKINLVRNILNSPLLTGSKAGGLGGKAKVAVAAVIGTVAPVDAEE